MSRFCHECLFLGGFRLSINLFSVKKDSHPPVFCHVFAGDMNLANPVCVCVCVCAFVCVCMATSWNFDEFWVQGGPPYQS